jgi:AAA family ATP:ADP antiporter
LIQQLNRLAAIRSGEAATAWLMFAYSFLAMTAYNIVKPATRSTAISEMGADNLPYLQLAAGLLIGLLMQGYSGAAGRLPRRSVVPLTQGLLAALLVLFWVLLGTGNAWVPTAFYIFGLVLGLLLISQFWTLANDLYDSRQARRLFGFIGGGASLGGAMGAGITRTAVDLVGTRHLLLLGAVALLLCVAITMAVLRLHASDQGLTLAVDDRGVGGGEAWTMLRKSRHLRVIAAMIAMAALGAVFVEQQLNMAAEAGAESMDAITRFLADVTMYLSLVGFVVQVGLTSRLHRSFGLIFALLLLPLSLGGTAVAILLSRGLWAPAAARVLDTSLSCAMCSVLLRILRIIFRLQGMPEFTRRQGRVNRRMP